VSREETIVLYVLITLSLTGAALAALVGAVGVFKLHLLREQHRQNEQTIRGLLAGAILSVEEAFRSPMHKLVPIARAAETKRARLIGPLAEWERFPARRQKAAYALTVFEVWNLLVIGLALAGFNYIPMLVAYFPFWTLWAVAVGAVVTTFGCVILWMEE